MSRLARARALHFLVLGGSLWLVVHVLAPLEPRARGTVVIPQGRVEQALAQWRARTGAPPDGPARRALLDALVDEELLFRLGLEWGLDRQSPVVARRLTQLARFTEESGPDAAGVLARLGLGVRDPVMRRAVLAGMRRLVEAQANADPPGRAELERYRRAHAQELETPAQWRIEQVFFDAALRGERAARTAAARMAEQLRRGEAAGGRNAGDPFPEPFPVSSRDGLTRRLGPTAAEVVAGAPVGAWIGPIRSPLGFHVLRVVEHVPAHLPPVETLRVRLVEGVRAERSAARLRVLLTELRVRTRVIVEDGAPEATS